MLPPTPDLLRAPAEIVAALSVSRAPSHEPVPRSVATRLRHEGYAVLSEVLSPVEAGELAAQVTALCAAGWPGVFALLLDRPWSIARELEKRIRLALGTDYEVLADAWAWSIPAGHRGWPPHRGGGAVKLDREAPELITAWVALSDVPADRACMHVVPLSDDASYPTHLESTEAPLEWVRAVPLSAGETAIWNANVLHWGGTCSMYSSEPRVSLSYSFGRVGAANVHGVPTFDPASSLNDRLDLIAAQIAVYGKSEPSLSPVIRDWATATQQLRRQIAGLAARKAT